MARYDEIMRPARRRVEAFDRIDGAPQSAHPVDTALRTVMMALEEAINKRDWDLVGDAQVMLQQIELKHRPAEQKDAGFYLMEKPS